jgi:hypothetical protein
MVVHNSGTKTNAKKMASRFRKMGFQSSVFKKGKGYGISVTRKKK